MTDDDLLAENARLAAAAASLAEQAATWRTLAEQQRVQLERLRTAPVVAQAYPLLDRLRRAAGPPARAVADLRRRVRRVTTGPSPLAVVAARQCGPARLRALRASLPPPPTVPDPGGVDVVVPTVRDDVPLDRLVAAVRRAGADVPGAVRVVVVDNGGHHDHLPVAGAAGTDGGADVVRVVGRRDWSFSTAVNAGVAAGTGGVVVLCNDDVVPVDDGWLPALVAALLAPRDGDAGTDEVGAAGARLLHAPRAWPGDGVLDMADQHAGIVLRRDDDGDLQPVNATRAPSPGAPRVRRVLAATGACLALRRRDWDALDGLDETYVFGAEDVDLCVRLARAGRPTVVADRALLLHHEGRTRRASDAAVRHRRQAANWTAFTARHGPWLARHHLLDLLSDQPHTAQRPLQVGITVTRGTTGSRYGDGHTAAALGAALERSGVVVRHLERHRDAWYSATAGLDALVVLHDTFDVRRVARPTLLTVGWVRNWVDRWIHAPWFDALDLRWAASPTIAAAVSEQSGWDCAVVPLATDAARFVPGRGPRDGVLVPVHNWGDDRGVPALVAAVPGLRVVGRGWDDLPDGDRAGPVPWEDLPTVYARARAVVDLSAPHTAGTGSVNARVMDALAAGTPVVSNQPGVRDLFGDDVPVFTGPHDLPAALAAAEDPARVARARATVLAQHTYTARGALLRTHLRDLARRPLVALLTGAPAGTAGDHWGDLPFAAALAVAVRRHGWRAAVLRRDDADGPVARRADVVVHLAGRGGAPTRPGQVNVTWIISHPGEVTDDRLAQDDLVLAASERLVADLRNRLDVPVELLLQATDTRRFRPLARDPRHAHDVVFVGNSKFAGRPIVDMALAAGLAPVVHGRNWERFAAHRHVASTHVPNDELPAVYASAGVVLNDHWPDMRRWGLVSNRVFDVLGCGGTVVSDDLPELRAVFGDLVAVVSDADELAETVARLLARDDAEVAAHRRRARAAVVAAHDVVHRAHRLLELLAPLVGPLTGADVTTTAPPATALPAVPDGADARAGAPDGR